uniref:Putative conserved plasma membrane protein n=1 Tax=Ixodes ricinus TaxID=34613 RepID=A0A090XFC0_IXORI
MLLHINAKTNFNVLASTDLPQKWGKGQKRAVGEKYAPRKIVNLPGLEKVEGDPVLLPKGDILGRLLEGLTYRSAALRHTEEIRPLGWLMNCISSFFFPLTLLQLVLAVCWSCLRDFMN